MILRSPWMRRRARSPSWLDALSATDAIRPGVVRALGPKAVRSALYAKRFAGTRARSGLARPRRRGGARPSSPCVTSGATRLPAFTDLREAFLSPVLQRPRASASESEAELAGYNHQTMAAVTGPGYFMARSKMRRTGEILVDYGRLARHRRRQSGWPAGPVERDEASRALRLRLHGRSGASRLGARHDRIRGLAQGPRASGSYFVLSRQDTQVSPAPPSASAALGRRCPSETRRRIPACPSIEELDAVRHAAARNLRMMILFVDDASGDDGPARLGRFVGCGAIARVPFALSSLPMQVNRPPSKPASARPEGERDRDPRRRRTERPRGSARICSPRSIHADCM